MNINTLLANIKAALKADSPLDQWCQSNYGKSPTIFNGIDRSNLPAESDYPLVVLRQAGKNGGIAADNEVLELVMVCGVFNDEVIVDGNGDPVCTGELHMEEMRQLAMAASAKADMDGGYISTWETAVDPEDQHPAYLIATLFTVERPYVFRENRME